VAASVYGELVPVPRWAIRWPLELPVPQGFAADRPETWPLVDGEVEYVGGKLLYMPPSADRQQDTAVDVATVLGIWWRSHREFVVGGNEAGMILGGETRGADAAVWQKHAAGPREGRYRRTPPVLAVEVQGELEDEAALLEKAQWYLSHGVEVVWLLFPSRRDVLVLTKGEQRAFAMGQRLAPQAALPGLEPAVDELFAQLSEGA
jgi:Uma2 family endonuclease